MFRRIDWPCVAVVLLVLAIGFLPVDRAYHPPRPAGVPESAVRVSMSMWQSCSIAAPGETYCRITNKAGTVLVEGLFVPVTGPAPQSAADLRIQPRGGGTWIQLESGAILVPKATFAEVREFLKRAGVLDQ